MLLLQLLLSGLLCAVRRAASIQDRLCPGARAQGADDCWGFWCLEELTEMGMWAEQCGQGVRGGLLPPHPACPPRSMVLPLCCLGICVLVSQPEP